MSTYIQNFIKFRPLLNELIMRDIKTKYRKSILGVFWTILNPLFMMVVLSVVFSNLFKFDIEYFPVYLLSGQLIFNFYNENSSAIIRAFRANWACKTKGFCLEFNHSNDYPKQNLLPEYSHQSEIDGYLDAA